MFDAIENLEWDVREILPPLIRGLLEVADVVGIERALKLGP
jgi:hypothetical protein